MWSKIVGWLAGGGISAIGDQLNKAYDRKLTADTDEKKLEAEQEISYLNAKRDILLKEQDNWFTRSIRPAFAYPFIIFIWKVVVWDKVLGWGTTDPLSDNMAYVLMTIIAAYFLPRGVQKIVRDVRRK